jgi:F420-non-reducing hydrogenase iron-sulfur subunit
MKMSKVLNENPKIIAFLCRWCSSNAADIAGVSRFEYPANYIPIVTPCSGRVEPSYVFDAFAEGADGVLVAGCHLGDCHYISGNYKTFKRMMLVKELAKNMGIEEERIRLEWISSAEATKLVKITKEMLEELKHLPPANYGKEGISQEDKK